MELASIDAPDDLKTAVTTLAEFSRSNKIVTQQGYDETASHLRSIKTALKRADEFFDPPIKQAYDLHKLLCQRKRMVTDQLLAAEKADKVAMVVFDTEQRQKAEAERRRLQAIADEKTRVEREKIEAEAAKQRAIEAEQRAKAEAARMAAEQAEAAERKKLLAQAEAADRKAAAASVKAEAKAEVAMAVQAPVVEVSAPVQKPSGVSIKKTWKAQIHDLQAFLEFVCTNKRTDLVLPNEKVLDALAKGMRCDSNIPGVKFFEVSNVSAKGS